MLLEGDRSKYKKMHVDSDKYEERKIRSQKHQNKLGIKIGCKVRFSKDLEVITELFSGTTLGRLVHEDSSRHCGMMTLRSVWLWD